MLWRDPWLSKVRSILLTDHNEQNEVDPVPERVGILHVVHDIRPSLQRDHKEDGHPCEADVVE